MSLINIFRKKKTISDNTSADEWPKSDNSTATDFSALDNLSFLELQSLIDQAQQKGEPIVQYVRKQIHLLDKAHDEFIKQALANGYSLSDSRVGYIELQQYAAMRQLARQIGDPTEKYDILIRRVRERIIGVENARIYFNYDWHINICRLFLQYTYVRVGYEIKSHILSEKLTRKFAGSKKMPTFASQKGKPPQQPTRK